MKRARRPDLVHFRYVYGPRRYSPAAICGEFPGRWKPGPMPAKMDGICPYCAAVLRQWRPLRCKGLYPGRIILARPAQKEAPACHGPGKGVL